jgi:nitrogenase molybdenum-iron protein alpha/beta subunit
MKKSDLKTGMLIKNRRGESYFVFIDAYTKYTENKRFAVRTDGGDWLDLEAFNEDLENTYAGAEWDVLQISTVGHPRDLYENFDNKLIIWKRDDKSESEKQLDGFAKEIEHLKNKLEKLREVIKGKKEF